MALLDGNWWLRCQALQVRIVQRGGWRTAILPLIISLDEAVCSDPMRVDADANRYIRKNIICIIYDMYTMCIHMYTYVYNLLLQHTHTHIRTPWMLFIQGILRTGIGHLQTGAPQLQQIAIGWHLQWPTILRTMIRHQKLQSSDSWSGRPDSSTPNLISAKITISHYQSRATIIDLIVKLSPSIMKLY